MSSECTYVRVTLPAVHKESALKIFEDHHECSDEETPSYNNELICFQFNEIPYGDPDFLEDLEEAGIAFDSDYGSGSDWASGTASCRFTEEGDVIAKNVSDDETNPSLTKLMDLIDKPEELRAYILKHKEEITPLPWANQVEYGKRYLARQLITP